MSAQTDNDLQQLDEIEKPCEAPFVECRNAATCMVWCDHHILGCDYSGFRCDIHRNLLELDFRRYLDALNAGRGLRCANCGQQVSGGNMSDHFRWIRI